MHRRSPFRSALLGLLATGTANAALACGLTTGDGASATPPNETTGEGGGESANARAQAGVDARALDAPKSLDGGHEADSEVIYDCNPTNERIVVALTPENCVGWEEFAADAGIDAYPGPGGYPGLNVDAGLDPDATAQFVAQCEINCYRACQPYSFGPTGSSGCEREGAESVACIRQHPCGRATEGCAPSLEARSVGELLAGYAQLEAAAVFAFERMALELRAHDAPRALVDAALAAAEDERRHTRLMVTLARRRGVVPDLPDAPSFAPRPLFAVALENATEGCVRETFGALVAHYQAAHANDDTMRIAARAIAEDETNHAELSWQLAEWLTTQLTPDENAAIERARSGAFVDLTRNSALAMWEEAGLPDPTTARELSESLARSARALGAALRSPVDADFSLAV